MGSKLPFIVVITIIKLHTIFSFERIILNSFSDPSTTRREDFWTIQDSDNLFQEYDDYLNCKNDRYFGPMENKYSIYRELCKLGPFHELKGEFQLLLLNKIPGDIFSDNIYLQFDEKRIIDL